MPRGDGIGPDGKVPRTGRGLGKSAGTEMGRGSGQGQGRDQGKDRNSGGGYSGGGYCVCTKCGTKVDHQQGVPCTNKKCLHCGNTMIREELLNKRKNK